MDPAMTSVFAPEGAVPGVGAALATLILTGQRSLRTETAAVDTRRRGEINAVEARLGR